MQIKFYHFIKFVILLNIIITIFIVFSFTIKFIKDYFYISYLSYLA